MKRKLPQNFTIQKFHTIVFLIGIFIVGINQNVIAQCTISGSNINASTLSCGITPSLTACNGVLNVGDGVTPLTIVMDADLDLTCLGAVQLIVNKTTFDFSEANKRLYLATGSSISFVNGGTLYPPGGNGGGCTGNDRVYIGGVLLATCQGGAGILSFEELIELGGTGRASSNSPVCAGNNIVLSVIPPPNGIFTYVWTGPNGFASTSQNPTPFTATTSPVTAGMYTVSIKRTSDNLTFSLSTTVVVNAGTLPSTPTVSLVQPTCLVATGTISVLTPTPDGVLKYSIDGLTYTNTTGIFNSVSSGTYSVTVKNISGCVSPELSATINAQPVTPSAPTGAMAQSFCSEASPTVASLSVTGTSIQWYGASSGGSVLATSTALINGNHYFASQTANGCESINRFDVTVTINTAPAPPVLAPTLTLPCSATAFIANWGGAANAVNYHLTVATDVGFSSVLPSYSNKVLGNVLSENVTGLAIGATFYVRLQSVNGCGTSANSGTMVVSVPTTTYNGGWDNGVPDSTKKAIFASTYPPITSQLNVCSCQINSGVNVVVGVPGGVNADAILKIENGLDVQGTGTLTFENNASLIQTNNSSGLNSGSIIYKRISTPMNNFDYTYWSSPVSGQTLKELVPNTLSDKYFSWGATNWVGESPATVMTPPGKGYIIRVPKPGVYGLPYPETVVMPYAEPVKFVGVPNNGHYDLTINTAGLYNLIGNPYPSALNADKFLAVNASQLGGTIYFWTHNTGIAPTGYASADYATYNSTGGVAATGPGLNQNVPTGNIAAGQSFFALSKGSGPVVFNNDMRVSSVGAVLDNSNFFRGTKSKTTAIEKSRIWLNMTNTGGAFKQMLVGYISGATNSFDSAFDGESFNGNAFVDFYSINENKNLVIQGRAQPFDFNDQVSLGYRTTIDGTFEISIDHADGNLSNQPVFIEDKLTNVIHNLKNGSYSFTTAKGTFKDRLVLRYTNKELVAASLGNTVFDEKEKGLVVSVENHKIKINSFDENMDRVMVYDLKGSLLYDNNKINNNEFTIPNFNSSDQFLIVIVQLSGGKWVTKEIVF